MTIKGRVVRVGQTEAIGAKGFKKRQLVIDTEAKYNSLVPFEFKQDKASLLDGLTIGTEVTVHFNLGGREYNGKYYADVEGWKIDVSQYEPTEETEELPF